MQQALAAAMKAHGFLKAGPTWRKTTDDAVAVFNIQGSQWGRQYYVNLGTYFRAAGDRGKPCEYHCHIRMRLTDVVPDSSRLNDLLDFEKPMELAQRLDELTTLVQSRAIPWLETMATRKGARDFLQASPSPSPLVTLQAKIILGLA